MNPHHLYIGLMSGTSMDGIDAVAASFGEGLRWQGVHAHAFVPYPAALKTRLLALQNHGEDELHRAAMLAQELAVLNGQAVVAVLNAGGLRPADIDAIGCHGQTVRHAPQQGYSLQLIDLARLAEISGITTVGDFRSRDLAAGGQGAPLVPAFHQAVFAQPERSRVVLNLGGIANISVLPAGGAPAFGFDTGPANMLMDAWVAQHWDQDYDDGGRLAAQGRVLPVLLDRLLAHGYFCQPPPKSTGRDLFSLAWLQAYLDGSEHPADVLRTLLHLTATSAADAIRRAAPDCDAIYACGGGVGNTLLMTQLAQQLPDMRLSTTAELGLPPQQVEAAAFAWLAGCWRQGLPVAVHHATGARAARVLGCGHWGHA